jgi:hypothetical protein
MSDPRYTDPLNDPRRPAVRRPLEDDRGSGTMWSWIVGIIAVIVVAMMVYGYNKPISTAGNPPATNSSTTTGAAPASAPGINPPVSEPTPAGPPRRPRPPRQQTRRASL